MKIKLKKNESLSSMDNHCELNYNDWANLNQGKTIEIEELNKFIEDKVQIVYKSKNQKKSKENE